MHECVQEAQLLVAVAIEKLVEANDRVMLNNVLTT
jgi:hypothetical protein